MENKSRTIFTSLGYRLSEYTGATNGHTLLTCQKLLTPTHFHSSILKCDEFVTWILKIYDVVTHTHTISKSEIDHLHLPRHFSFKYTFKYTCIWFWPAFNPISQAIVSWYIEFSTIMKLLFHHIPISEFQNKCKVQP